MATCIEYNGQNILTLKTSHIDHEYVFTYYGVEYRFSYFISEKERQEKISEIISNHRNKVIDNVLDKN